jgi:Spy/CpxP family protein refolding chaperone
MKTMKMKSWLILMLLLAGSAAIYGQKDMGMHQNLPGLTEDQKTQIEKLRITHMKEMQTAKNLVAENRARYQTLMTADKPDMTAINKNIDEYSALKGDMMKKQAAHRQEIRKLLNDEQRLIFDSRQSHDGKGMKNGGTMGRGKMGHGHGGGQIAPQGNFNKKDCPMHSSEGK